MPAPTDKIATPVTFRARSFLPVNLEPAVRLYHKTTRYAWSLVEYLYYGLLHNRSYDLSYLMKISETPRDVAMRIRQKRHYVCVEIDTDEKRFYEMHFQHRRQAIITRAQTVCAHAFSFFGSGPPTPRPQANPYSTIDWHSDSKSEYRWNPETFFRRIQYGTGLGAEILVPWAVSRFQDRLALAQAFVLTEDKTYPVEFQHQVIDWLDHNRIGFGVNWQCAMEAAIRAANWLVILDLFGTRYSFPESFLVRLYGSLYDHGRHIRHTLEKSRPGQGASNHYIAELAGLLFIAVYCPFFKTSREWQRFALVELEKEALAQVYPDGCDYEAFTAFHLFVTEVFFYVFLLCDRAGIRLSDRFRLVLQGMLQAIRSYTKPTGLAPQIGDNSNLRFLRFTDHPVLDHTHLLNLATIHFQNPAFRIAPQGVSDELFWLYGRQAYSTWQEMSSPEALPAIQEFPWAGWFILRRDRDYCIVSCGPTGQGGKGGHAHNDKLSFELMLAGQDVIVDTGTYVFTARPLERSRFRSTAYHNSIQFDDYEQNEPSTKSVFLMPERVKIGQTFTKETENSLLFSGEISYLDITHQRIIVLDIHSNCWLIRDTFSCDRPIKARLTFHLAPELLYADGTILVKKTSERVATIAPGGYRLEHSCYDYSPEYGVKLPAVCLNATVTGKSGVNVVTTCISRA